MTENTVQEVFVEIQADVFLKDTYEKLTLKQKITVIQTLRRLGVFWPESFSEQTINLFNSYCSEVVLVKCGPDRLHIVKAIKNYTGLGLKESKDILDCCLAGSEVKIPNPLQRNLEEIESFVKELVSEGCHVRSGFTEHIPSPDQEPVDITTTISY